MFSVSVQMSSKRSSDGAGISGLLSVVAFIACMLFSLSAFAQNSGSSGISISAADSGFVSQVTNDLNQLESTIQSNFSNMSGTLAADGAELEWVLFSVMFVWTAITGMLKGVFGRGLRADHHPDPNARHCDGVPELELAERSYTDFLPNFEPVWRWYEFVRWLQEFFHRDLQSLGKCGRKLDVVGVEWEQLVFVALPYDR